MRDPPSPTLSRIVCAILLLAAAAACRFRSPIPHSAPEPIPTPISDMAARNRAAIELGRRLGSWPTHLEPVEANLAARP